ncbi:MAG: NAD(P)-dependent alcohol dehydrogenase [Verrucomicrobiota bacterium]|nr:NAD(P)-dependent alcohol dehydrogenase [Verrucomicrobiota bacterium]
MGTTFQAYAASARGAQLQPFEFDPGPLRDDQVEIAVAYCGVCHSDLSMWHNEWGITKYPFVPGHEVAGRVAAVGAQVRGVKIGQRVGLGWYAGSCMACPQCLSGNHNLCPAAEATIVERHGGFANHVRCHWAWAVPLPEALDAEKSSPLFCGGITVFNPLLQCGVQPTDRAGVIGIGGLGHLALQFLNKWGCEVTGFSSSDSKRDEAVKFGAHHVVNSRDAAQLQKIAGSLNFILSTVNAPLPWEAFLGCLAPKGRLHIVGAVLEPIPVTAFSLIGGQKTLSGTPLGSPFNTARMLEFSARHGIAPVVEVFPMSKVNEALEHLRAGRARYRIVLRNDFA